MVKITHNKALLITGKLIPLFSKHHEGRGVIVLVKRAMLADRKRDIQDCSKKITDADIDLSTFHVQQELTDKQEHRVYALTIFYDGRCPLCVREMRQLKQRDDANAIQLIDLHSEQFTPFASRINAHAADRILHGLTADNQLLLGLDVTHQAWSLVGRGWMTAPLRWPVIRWFADHGYRFFARHRNRIAYLLTGERECQHCAIGPNSAVSKRKSS